MKFISFVNTFNFQVSWRLVALTTFVVVSVVAYLHSAQTITVAVFCGITALVLMWNILYFVNDTNRRLSRFFESVQYSDFAIRFATNQEKNPSSRLLNEQFNEVLEAFRQTRAEKEANLLFMNTIVQHLGAGILAFDMQGKLLISNHSAFQLLGVYRVQQLSDLPAAHDTLQAFVDNLKGKGKILYQPDVNRQISVQGVAINLQGRNVRLITLQNIHVELQRKEVDAWRDLTRVLRHEIMNSVTPIVTIIETMKDIVHTDLGHSAATEDLEEALEIVGSRSRSLLDFVEAYRIFSSPPVPKIESVKIAQLVERCRTLVAATFKEAHIQVQVEIPDHFGIQADPGQIEMVLLNLFKNAREALLQSPNTQAPLLKISAVQDSKGGLLVIVEDNGPGIDPELMEEIFIPFYTTKATGTGVGLSISRQIMQLHGGDIQVLSIPEQGAKFVLRF